MFKYIFDKPFSGEFLRRESMAGLTTFMTMAYIIFVQPAVLSGAMFGFDTGMNAGALMVATCLSAAFASILMGNLGDSQFLNPERVQAAEPAAADPASEPLTRPDLFNNRNLSAHAQQYRPLEP